MRDEFTTKMHGELLGDEVTPEELRTMGIYGAQVRGVPIGEVLRKYKVTQEEYEANYRKYLDGGSTYPNYN